MRIIPLFRRLPTHVPIAAGLTSPVPVVRFYIGIPVCIAMGIFAYRKEMEHSAHIDHEMYVPPSSFRPQPRLVGSASIIWAVWLYRLVHVSHRERVHGRAGGVRADSPGRLQRRLGELGKEEGGEGSFRGQP